MKKIISVLLTTILAVTTLLPAPIKAEEPSDINEEVIYHILVDRYNNGRQAPSEQVDVNDPETYHGGDIDGITKQIDIIDDHGFTTIALSPIFANAKRGYHGYWVEDFYDIEEEFGDIKDLKKLITEAHNREIKVMLELPLNYVSRSHPMVSEKDKQDWFKDNDVEPIEATAWLDEVAVFDQSNKEVQKYLTDLALHWMDEVEIDGYIFQAADQSDPAFLETLTKKIKEKTPHFYLVANSLQGEGDMSALRDIEAFDAVANHEVYEAMNEIFTKADQPVSKVFEAREENSFRDLVYVDTLNTARFSNNFGDNGRNAVTTWSLALAYLYLQPGVPIIYQGSEVPMYGPGYPENQAFVDFTSADPDLEKVFDQMSGARKQFPVLATGTTKQVATNKGLSLFERTLDDRSIFVAINNDSESRVVEIPSIGEEYQLRGLLHDDTIRENDEGNYLIGMERESAEIFIVESNTGFNWTFIGFLIAVFTIFTGAIIILQIRQSKREKQAKK